MRRISALLCAILVIAAPALAASSRSKAKKQLEFGVEMALKGSWREAAFRFRKAVKSDPDNPFAYSNLGVALESTGEFDEALKAYEKALALAPGNDRIEENLERLRAYLATVDSSGFKQASSQGGTGSEEPEGNEPRRDSNDGKDDGS